MANEKLDIAFYKGKDVDPELFDGKAKKVAEKLAEDRGVTYTSLRRLFDEAKRFQMILAKKGDFAAQLPYIKMIKSKTAYTVARQKKLQRGNRAYDYVKMFIDQGVDQIKEQRDYDVFVSLFEAVCGYYYDLADNKNK